MTLIANFRVNTDKCAYAKDEVVILCFGVSKEVIIPNTAKVQGITDLRTPKNVN